MKMSRFKKYLKVFSIFVISFLSLVTLFMIFAFCIGDVTVGNFILFICVEICLIGMFIELVCYFSTFAYKVYFENDNIVFQFKNKTYTYNRNDCKKIFTNGMITKFTFYNKKIRCAKNDYFDDNTGQLKDKLNKEFFPNAIITKIWD